VHIIGLYRISFSNWTPETSVVAKVWVCNSIGAYDFSSRTLLHDADHYPKAVTSQIILCLVAASISPAWDQRYWCSSVMLFYSDGTRFISRQGYQISWWRFPVVLFRLSTRVPEQSVPFVIYKYCLI